MTFVHRDNNQRSDYTKGKYGCCDQSYVSLDPIPPNNTFRHLDQHVAPLVILLTVLV